MKIKYSNIIKSVVLFAGSCIALTSCQRDGQDTNRGTNAPDHAINIPDAAVYPVVNASHLVAYWNFNNNTKEQISDRVPTIKKMAYGRDRNGFKSSCMQGNATDVWFTVPADAALKSASVTVSVWVKPEQSGGGACFIASLTKTGTWDRGYALFQDGTPTNYRFKALDNHACANCGGYGANWFDVTGGYPNNQWFHLAYMWDAVTNTQTVYVNGAEFKKAVQGTAGWPQGALQYTDGTGTAEKFYVGYNADEAKVNDWIKPLKGQIDDLRIYNTALTAAEVQQIYNNEKVK